MAATGKVLVIDDDPTACLLIERVLGGSGLEVLTSSDPHAGIETAAAIIPDLIFINLLLSDTNGLKISKAIHAVKGLEKVPVIMLISHRGELDPKYTATIGILDTLVKPLMEAEIIAKTRAILGDAAVAESEDELVGEISLEEEMEPTILPGKEDLSDGAAPASDMETLDEYSRKEYSVQEEKVAINELTTEEEAYMPEQDSPFNKKQDNDRSLFADESDIFGEESEISSPDLSGEKLQEKEEDSGFSEEDLSYEEEKPASPVKRILLITASIVVGIGLGIGGYFFFTAGNKPVPVEKQVTTVLPEPANIPSPPDVPAEKSNVIPEIPVKAEPQKPEPAQAKEAKPVEARPTPEKKKQMPVKQAAKKETSDSVEGRGAYYVQAGLFENEKNAENLAGKIKQKGFTPTIRKETNTQKKTLYRVTVGNYSSKKKAVDVSKALGKQGVQSLVRKQ